MRPGREGRREVAIEGFRIDAVDETGRLVEVQSGALGPLRGKLRRLLPEHRIRIVKPVVLKRRLVRRSQPRWTGRLGTAQPQARRLSRRLRRSDRRGPNLPPFQPGDRGPGGHDRRGARASPSLAGLSGRRSLPRRDPRSDLACPGRRPVGALAGGLRRARPFTTRELAEQLERPLWFAQRVAYCLRLTGAARVVGKAGNQLIYVRGLEHARSAQSAEPRSGKR